MPEESHLAEMRAQIRADRERAAKRNPSLLVPAPAPPEPRAEPEPDPEVRESPPGRLRRLLRRV